MRDMYRVGFALLLGLLGCTADRPTAPTPTAPPRELFVLNGTGNTVFDLPTGVTRLRITGRFDPVRLNTSENFIVWIGNRLVVNEILGSCGSCIGLTYEGTHQVSGTTGVIEKSTGVVWTLTEIR